MYDWLSVWAAIAPDRIAISEAMTGRDWTYRVLNERAARLAAALHDGLGLGAGDRVAMLSSARPEVFETMFACVKLGAIFVPLNWRLAVPELQGIVRDCGPAAFIFDDRWAANASQLVTLVPPGRVIALGEGAGSGESSYEQALAEARPRALGDVNLEAVCMILYTSGTTGRPKGAMITWRQVLFNAVNTSLAVDLSANDRCLAFLPLFHTGGLHCVATPLFHRGGSVVLMGEFDPAASVALLERGDITTTIAVPTMYQMLLDAGLGRRPVPQLKALLCGGAPCPEPLIERCHESGLPLRQGYGLTEVGPNCFTLAPLEGPHRVGSVGRPAFHSQARLVDANGNEVPVDTPGELWLRGPHVTAGYWNKPEETRKALDADGWFHTGDSLRRTEDGFFYVVGRVKDMFISGGENVYPAEVENALAGHPAVDQVTVVGVPDEKWGQVGLAAIVLKPGLSEPIDGPTLRDWARQRIAPYKVPKHWRFVAELPLTSSGKVRKDAVVAELWEGA